MTRALAIFLAACLAAAPVSAAPNACSRYCPDDKLAGTIEVDPVGRPVSMNHDLSGTAGDVSLTFAYNPANQIASRTLTNDSYAWTEAAVSRPYAVNGQNQYTSAGSASFTRDSRHMMNEASSYATACRIPEEASRQTMTCGEGNNWKQSMLLNDVWRGPVQNAWFGLNRRLGF